MEKIKSIPLSVPQLGEEEWLAVKEPLFSGWVTTGPKVAEFEKLFAELHNVDHAIAVANGTCALHLALLAMGIKEGDEVIVPAFSWIASANAVRYCNAKPVFVDVDPTTFNIDVRKIASKISANTKAIMAVHLFGLCADIDEIKKQFPGIPIIEDAACAAGAKYYDESAGGLGDIACFSFHPRKTITTGEGGMVTTNNPAYNEKIRSLRNHGGFYSAEILEKGVQPHNMPKYNSLGYNYRLTDIQASIGISQLYKLEKFIQQREQFAFQYINELKEIQWLTTPVSPQGYRHSWQAFVVMINESESPIGRNRLMEVLAENGVQTRPGTHAIHMLGYYAKLYNIKPSDFLHSRDADSYSIALPLHNNLTIKDLDYIINILKKIDNHVIK